MTSPMIYPIDDKDLDDAALRAAIDSIAAAAAAFQSRKPLAIKNTNHHSPNPPIPIPFSKNPRNHTSPAINHTSPAINFGVSSGSEVIQNSWEDQRPQKMARYCGSTLSGTSPLAVAKHLHHTPTTPSFSSPEIGRFSVKEYTPSAPHCSPTSYADSEVKEGMRHSLSGRCPTVSLFKEYQNAAMEANVQSVVGVLLDGLKDSPHVAEMICGALYNLAQGYIDSGTSSSMFMTYVPSIIQHLIQTADRTDVIDSQLRSSAYETLNEVIRCAVLSATSDVIVQLLHALMSKFGQILSSEDREKQGDVQASLCGVLQVIIQKLGGSDETKTIILQAADQIMMLFFRVFDCRSSTVHEEAMLAVGALAYATGQEFGKYMNEFYKYLERGLQNFEKYQVCAVSIGVVGDICSALDVKFLPYCDGIMTLLLKDLSRVDLHKSVKPSIFSCFGKVAIAIGHNFEKYISYVMPIWQGAAEVCVQIGDSDEEMLEYRNLLRRSIFEAYSGILRGCKNSKADIILPYVPHLLQSIEVFAKDKHRDESVTKAATEVLHDLAKVLGDSFVDLRDTRTSIIAIEKEGRIVTCVDGRTTRLNTNPDIEFDGYNFVSSESYDKLRKIHNGGLCAIEGRTDLAQNLVTVFDSLLVADEGRFDFDRAARWLCDMQILLNQLGPGQNVDIHGFLHAGYDGDLNPSIIFVDQNLVPFKFNPIQESGVSIGYVVTRGSGYLHMDYCIFQLVKLTSNEVEIFQQAQIAVAYACLLDPYSGGFLRTIQLDIMNDITSFEVDTHFLEIIQQNFSRFEFHLKTCMIIDQDMSSLNAVDVFLDRYDQGPRYIDYLRDYYPGHSIKVKILAISQTRITRIVWFDTHTLRNFFLTSVFPLSPFHYSPGYSISAADYYTMKQLADYFKVRG